MTKYFSQYKIVLTVILAILLVALIVSACDIIGIGGEEPRSGPSTSGIITPANETRVLAGAPVQIQSSYTANNIARVELWVKGPNENEARLLRADVPTDGSVLQQWVSPGAGTYTITTRAFSRDSASPLTESTVTIQVIDNGVVLPVIEPGGEAAALSGPVLPTQIPPTPLAPPSGVSGAFAAPTPEVIVQVVATAAPAAASPTPIPRYPPPPPVPGVPWGPTQSPLLNLTSPICDAADYVGVYTADTRRRVVITEPDDIAARVAGGITVFRAWRLQNVGTCTWGPGYELAFYGGRSMGSGGVAFESTFPAEPARRNALVETNRLIVPEGKPNQTAVVEVALNTPVTPGIHQSYWRMRNPHGAFFGPVIGVTMEVVRDCQARLGEPPIYGAPTINRFRILGIDTTFEPVPIPITSTVPGPATPIPPTFRAEVGQLITLDWDIINAVNFDIIVEDPTGDIQNLSTTDPSDRANFTPTRVGDYIITIFADNGVCTVDQRVRIRVGPPEDSQFVLSATFAATTPVRTADADASFSPTVSPNTMRVQWEHFDPDTDEFSLIAEGFRRTYGERCPVVESIFGWKGHCYMAWSDWRSTGNRIALEVGDAGDAQGVATVANVERRLCPASFNPAREEYGIKYTMRAQKDGRPAEPEFSNSIDIRCISSNRTQLPTEIQGAGATFNPGD